MDHHAPHFKKMGAPYGVNSFKELAYSAAVIQSVCLVSNINTSFTV